ncbi:MAG: hypothetical protein GTO03_18465 [Planctomycetales bacterium]|nr:hypothetical protein [Planctomycetales bacterium]
MLREFQVRTGDLLLAAVLLGAGYAAGTYEGARPATAQDRFGEEGVRQEWRADFGFAIPAAGAALVRGQEGRAYLVTAEGKVAELSIGEGVRTPTPLRPR